MIPPVRRSTASLLGAVALLLGTACGSSGQGGGGGAAGVGGGGSGGTANSGGASGTGGTRAACPADWSTALPGVPTSLAVTPDGEVVVVGTYHPWAMPTPNWPDDGIFIAKVDASGALLLLKQFATFSDNGELNVAVGPGGSYVVTGLTAKFDFAQPAGSPDQQFERFMALFDASGQHLWSHWLGPSSNFVVGEVQFTPSGKIGLAGGFGAQLDFGGSILTPTSEFDGYVALLSPSGQLEAGKALGSRVTTLARPSGEEAVIARFDSSSPAPLILARTGWDGTVSWQGTYGSSAYSDEIRSLALAPSGEIYVAGYLAGQEFEPPISGPFWAKLSASGDVLAAKGLGSFDIGPGQQDERALAVNAAGESYLLGVDPSVADAPRNSSLWKLDGQGDVVMKMNFTGPDDDDLDAVAAHPCGAAVVVGWTRNGGSFGDFAVAPGGFVRLVR